MRELFVDTAGWLLLADAADPLHQRAVQVRDEWLEGGGLLVSTDYVMDETLTLLRIRLSLGAAEQWWHQVDNSPRVRWEWIDSLRAAKALGWFFRWHDQDFSFTDCTSFAVMKERRIQVALTCDNHFRIAGFQITP